MWTHTPRQICYALHIIHSIRIVCTPNPSTTQHFSLEPYKRLVRTLFARLWACNQLLFYGMHCTPSVTKFRTGNLPTNIYWNIIRFRIFRQSQRWISKSLMKSLQSAVKLLFANAMYLHFLCTRDTGVYLIWTIRPGLCDATCALSYFAHTHDHET